MASHISEQSNAPSPRRRRKVLAACQPSNEDVAIEAIHASVDFLLEALAEDLNAPIPSKEPAFLHIANDRVCLVRSLVERLKTAQCFLTTLDEHFGTQDQTPSSRDE